MDERLIKACQDDRLFEDFPKVKLTVAVLVQLAKYDSFASFRLADKLGFDPYQLNMLVFRVAAEFNSLRVLDYLYEKYEFQHEAVMCFGIRRSLSRGHLEAAEYLYSKLPTEELKFALLEGAVCSEDYTVFKTVCDRHELEASMLQSRILRTACMVYNKDIFQTLLDDGADPAVEPAEITKLALSTAHPDCLHALLHDTRFDPHAEEDYALRWSFREQHFRIAELYLRHAAYSPPMLDYVLRYDDVPKDIRQLVDAQRRLRELGADKDAICRIIASPAAQSAVMQSYEMSLRDLLKLSAPRSRSASSSLL